MESVQALLAAQAADTIVGFIHRVHRQERAPIPSQRLEFGDNEDFNVYVDEANGQVKIFELAYRPSEVLFAVDHEAYRDLLGDYSPDDEGEPDEGSPDATGGAS